MPKIGYFNLSNSQSKPAGIDIRPIDNLSDFAATDQIINGTSAAISHGDIEGAAQYFTPALKKIVEYSINFLNADGRSAFAELIANLKIASSTAEEKKYSSVIYFSGYQTDYYLTMQKQPDGAWLIANL